MDDRPSLFWNVALLFSLLFLTAVLYIKIEPFRTLVNDKCPWVKEQLASKGIRIPGTGSPAQPAAAAADSAPAAPISSQPVAVTKTALPPATNPASVPEATPPPQPQAPQKPATLAQIAADRTLWPQTVRLKKTTIFPAVLNGKKVGELNVPAGTEVKVMQINPDKIGVAYSPNGAIANAGGTWLLPEDTSLMEQVRSTH